MHRVLAEDSFGFLFLILKYHAYLFIYLLCVFCVCVCVCMHMLQITCVVIREQRVRVSSLLLYLLGPEIEPMFSGLADKPFP